MDENHCLYYDEVKHGLNKEIGLANVMPNCEVALKKAFDEAKNYGGDENQIGADRVDFREFRIMLELLHIHLDELQGKYGNREADTCPEPGMPIPGQKKKGFACFAWCC